MEQVLGQQLLQTAKVIEEQVDAEINKLDQMDEDSLEVLRAQRLKQLKAAKKQKDEWLSLGHGKYEEIAEEKEFFDACKKSKNVVCHFYRDETFRCKIVDKHLQILAPKHIETHFIKVNAERCLWLTERLNVHVIPTICLCKNGKTSDYIRGFDDLGGIDDFSTDMMEWRIARSDVINYSGDLLTPPDSVKKYQKNNLYGHSSTKTIRGKADSDDSDEDW